MAASLKIYLTGATSAGNVQADPMACLGGYRSSVLAPSHQVLRAQSGFSGLRIDHVSGAVGQGAGIIAAATTSTLQFGAPGEDLGTAVAVANGATAVLSSATARKKITVTRTAADDLLGKEELLILDQYNALGAGENFTSAQAAAGASYYLAAWIQNEGDASGTPYIFLVPWVNAEDGDFIAADVAQLGATGAGTIETSQDLSNWQTQGYVWIYGTATDTVAGVVVPHTLNEVCYYTRAGNVLTIASAHRALLGTSATLGVADQIIMPGPGMRLAVETPAADAIQTIADNTTAPTGLTWSSPQNVKTAITPAIAAGAGLGLWLNWQVPAGAVASPRVLCNVCVGLAADQSDADYLRGLHRVANDALAVYETYIGVNAAPDLTAAPDFTFTTSPHAEASIGWTAGNSYQLRTVARSAHNLATAELIAETIEIDDAGDVVGTRPSGPSIVKIAAAKDGKFIIQGRYFPELETDQANRADEWLIYLSVDGTAPDPATDTPIEVPMGDAAAAFGLSQELFYITTSGYLDGTPGEVLVRTRRNYTVSEVDYAIDSNNVDTYTATASTLGPGKPAGALATYGRADAVRRHGATVDADPVYIDEANNIYWVGDDDGISLYADTVLIWRWMWNTTTLYVPNTWDIDGTTTITGTGTGAVDVISWTVGDKRLGVNVNTARVAVIDVTNLIIYMTDSSGTVGGTTVAQTPTFARYAETLFQAWRAETEQMETYAQIGTAGEFTVAGNLDGIGYDQAAIEAL